MSDKLSKKTQIVCIIGPTASGKSGRAIALAKENNGEVISVDSRQVYRGLDIGTEKISVDEMAGIPHHLIDIRDANDRYSAGDFVEDTVKLIADITARGKLPILAGGTHYYFDSLLSGLPQLPEDPELRIELDGMSSEAIMEEIQARDPRRAAMLDPKNRRRTIRALEIIRTLGFVPPRPFKVRSDLTYFKQGPTLLGYEVEWQVLVPEREELRARIVTRLEDALQRGLIEEVRAVRDDVGDERLNELGLEYRIVGELLRGERDEDSLLPALSAKLFQYARRQEAWIKKLTR